MAQIGIADKVTLDSVKTDTGAIRTQTSNIASIKTTVEEVKSIATNSKTFDHTKTKVSSVSRNSTNQQFVNILDIAGKGTLIAIGGTSADFQIIIDGVNIYQPYYSASTNRDNLILLGFKNSLKINVNNSSSGFKVDMVYNLE